jgi:uncharacterized protein YgiM (DUF1202 family)
VQPLADGTYQIRLRAKDGVRVYINGNRVIDAWGGSAGQLFTHTFSIAKGEYRFTVEYFKNTGLGYVDYNLVLLDSRPIDQLYTLPGSGPPANFQPPQGQPPSQVQVPADLPPTGYIVTAADNTNLRNGPGTQFDVIGTMPFQAEASVIARDPALIWWLVNYNGTIGWVSTRLARIQPTANINVIPVLG